MQAGQADHVENTDADQRNGRMCVLVSEPGVDADTLDTALTAVAASVYVVTPTEVGAQLWRALGARLILALGSAAVRAVIPWLALLHSAPSTATMAVLDGSREEILAVLERFDLWLPGRTPAPVVVQQVVAQWSMMERLSRTSGPRRIAGYNMVIDLGREEVVDTTEQRIPLTRSEFRLLAAMAVQPGRVVDFWQLGAVLPGQFRDADDAYNSVKVHIGRLRQKLTRATGWDGHLVSVRGRGFMLERRAPRPAAAVADSTLAADGVSDA